MITEEDVLELLDNSKILKSLWDRTAITVLRTLLLKQKVVKEMDLDYMFSLIYTHVPTMNIVIGSAPKSCNMCVHRPHPSKQKYACDDSKICGYIDTTVTNLFGSLLNTDECIETYYGGPIDAEQYKRILEPQSVTVIK